MKIEDIQNLAEASLTEAAEDVETLGVHIIDGVFTKVFLAKKAGTVLGQHAHSYAHGHLVAAGRMRVFVNGLSIGDYGPGEMITIAAYTKHVLMTLEDNTIGCCIHNVHGEDEPIIFARSTLKTS